MVNDDDDYAMRRRGYIILWHIAADAFYVYLRLRLSGACKLSLASRLKYNSKSFAAHGYWIQYAVVITHHHSK